MQPSLKGPQQLVAPLPCNEDQKLLLSVIRRMGAHGINDAAACNILRHHFGSRYRQPYLLIRTVMLDLARHARLNITVAPCCCRQMTTDERQLLTVIQHATVQPALALMLLNDLTGNRECHGLLATIAAVNEAFAALGRPLDN